MQKTADVVVIGAGVMGSSIAFHLAQAGVKSIAVLDKKGIAQGNTKQSGALVRMHYNNEPETRLAFTALAYFHHWADLVGGSTDPRFRRAGVIFAVDGGNADKLRANVAMHQRVGVKTSVLDAAALRELQPDMRVDDLAVAAYEPDSGYADPVATTQALAKRAQDGGAVFYEGVAATALLLRGGRVAGVATSDGDIDAPVVVSAIGPWSNKLLAPLGLDLPISPHRAQIGFFERPRKLENGPVLIDIATGAYGRPNFDDTYMVGASAFAFTSADKAVAPDHAPDDPDDFNTDADPEYAAFCRAKMEWRYPGLFAAAAYRRGQAGIYDMTPDTRSILGPMPDVAGLYIAAGFSGQGFKKGPIIGKLFAELVVDGAAQTVDLHPFRLSRFAENDPIPTVAEYLLPADIQERM